MEPTKIDSVIKLTTKGVHREFIFIKRQAEKGDLIYITSGTSKASHITPFDNKYVGKCFIVGEKCDNDNFYPGVFIHMGDSNWMLYNDQYLVLKLLITEKELKN